MPDRENPAFRNSLSYSSTYSMQTPWREDRNGVHDHTHRRQQRYAANMYDHDSDDENYHNIRPEVGKNKCSRGDDEEKPKKKSGSKPCSRQCSGRNSRAGTPTLCRSTKPSAASVCKATPKASVCKSPIPAGSACKTPTASLCKTPKVSAPSMCKNTSPSVCRASSPSVCNPGPTGVCKSATTSCNSPVKSLCNSVMPTACATATPSLCSTAPNAVRAAGSRSSSSSSISVSPKRKSSAPNASKGSTCDAQPTVCVTAPQKLCRSGSICKNTHPDAPGICGMTSAPVSICGSGPILSKADYSGSDTEVEDLGCFQGNNCFAQF